MVKLETQSEDSVVASPKPELQTDDLPLASPKLASSKPLAPAAQRALAEAEERRRLRQIDAEVKAAEKKEIGGRDGLEPTRYGDWEVKGIASDF